MIRFQNINQLKQSELVEGDLIELFGEFQEGDGAVITGRVVPVTKQTMNRKVVLDTDPSLAVELYPSGLSVTQAYVDGSINAFHTDPATPYIGSITLTKMTDKISKDGHEYVPKYVPYTLTGDWSVDEDKLKKLPTNITTDNINQTVVDAVESNHHIFIAKTKQQFEQQIQLNKSTVKGSGIYEYGELVDAQLINQGFNGDITVGDTMHFTAGTKHIIDGVILHTEQTFKLPPAPIGYKSYDSDTKQLTNHQTYVDPRFGNAATDVNEAVARAFDGLTPNSDFRLGDQFWLKDGNATITSGLLTLQDSGSAYVGARMGIPVEQGKKYITEVDCTWVSGEFLVYAYYGAEGTSNSAHVQLLRGTALGNAITASGKYIIEWEARETNSNVFINLARETTSNNELRVHNFSTRKSSSEVVLTRRDGVYLYHKLESLDENDIVHVHGNMQYDQSSWKGITLHNDIVNQEYAAYGQWDTEVRGYAARWSELTDAQKALFIEDETANIYYDETLERYFQYKWGIGTIEGNFNAVSIDELFEQELITKHVGNDPMLYDWFSTYKIIPVAMCQRHNQGTYDPFNNPFGCARRLNTDGSSWNVIWFAGRQVTNTRQCFNFTGENRESLPFPNGTVVGGGYTATSGGSINAGINLAHKQSIYSFFDAIYAGQVEDLRLNAKPEDYHEMLLHRLGNDIKGKTRGIGNLPFTKVFDTEALANAEGYTEGRSLDGKFVAHKWLPQRYVILPWVDLATGAIDIQGTAPNGMLGMKLTDSPNNSLKIFPLNRKNSINTFRWDARQPDGSWQSSGAYIDMVINSFIYTLPVGNYGIWRYPVIANSMVHTLDNLEPVCDRSDVIAISEHRIDYGASMLFNYSGSIGTDTDNPTTYCTKLRYNHDSLTHYEDGFIAPTNSSPKSNIVVSLVNREGLLYTQYNGTNSTHDGTSWTGTNTIPLTTGIKNSYYPVGIA